MGILFDFCSSDPTTLHFCIKPFRGRDSVIGEGAKELTLWFSRHFVSHDWFTTMQSGINLCSFVSYFHVKVLWIREVSVYYPFNAVFERVPLFHFICPYTFSNFLFSNVLKIVFVGCYENRNFLWGLWLTPCVPKSFSDFNKESS